MEAVLIQFIHAVNRAELSILACVVGMVFFMRYNQHERSNLANRYIGMALGAGFIILVLFRVYVGVIGD